MIMSNYYYDTEFLEGTQQKRIQSSDGNET